MPAVVRWARLPTDPSEQDEHQLVDRAATLAALAALDKRAGELGAPAHVVDRVRTSYQSHLDQLTARSDDDAAADEQPENRLRLALIADKRSAVVHLRDTRHIDDIVLRRAQARLDAEKLRLSPPADEG